MNAALLYSAEGEWDKVAEALRIIINGPRGTEDSEKFVAVNNLAVALLSQGNLKEVGHTRHS